MTGTERENIERIEWTLRDPEWQPSRAYLEKVLAAYKEAVAENERLQTEKEMYRKAGDADGFHRVLAARDAEIERLRADPRPTAVQLHPEALEMVDERARKAGVSRESAVNALIIAVLSEVPGTGRLFK